MSPATKDNVGEPFWSIYEIDEDGEANGNQYEKTINGQPGAFLFFSKKLCEKFLARESLIVQTRYRVFGITQRNLRSFIMMADCFASNFYLVLDVKSSLTVDDITIGFVQIPRETLIEDYVLGEHGLPKEPMVAPSVKSQNQRGRESKSQPPEVIHLPPPSK